MITLEALRAIGNRGYAQWSIGRWSVAEGELDRCLRELAKYPDPMSVEAIHLRRELRTNAAMVSLARGDVLKAVALLEPERCSQCDGDGDAGHPQIIDKSAVLSHIVLAAALNASDRPRDAVDCLADVVDYLSWVEREGGSNAGILLAQTFATRATAWMLLGDTTRALEDADRSVTLYRVHIDKGGAHFRGQLANALFVRGRIHTRLDDGMDAAARDAWEATTLTKALLDEFAYECDVANVTVTHAIDLIARLPERFVRERRALLTTVLDAWEKALTDEPRRESLVIVNETVVGAADDLRALAERLRVSWPSNTTQ